MADQQTPKPEGPKAVPVMGAPVPAITVESHVRYVADIEAYAKKLEAEVLSLYTKYHVLAAAIAAFGVGCVVGKVL